MNMPKIPLRNKSMAFTLLRHFLENVNAVILMNHELI